MFEALFLRDNANDYRMTSLRRVQDAGDSVKGKVIVVTGATGALGKVLSSAFLQGGATVVMTGRSLAKAEQVKEEILESLPEGATTGTLVPMALDLGDFDSIRTFAKDLKTKFPKGIFALVNNAGTIADAYKETKQGIETSFQANFVSQVLLTELLIPQLTKVDTLPARIVNLSSLGHADAPNPIQWDDIPPREESFKGGYNKEYFEAKWLLTAYTAHLARRLSLDEASMIVPVTADPGVSPDSAMWDQVVLPIRFLARYVFKPLMKTSSQAAACSAHLAVTPSSLQPGGYYMSGVLLEKPLRSDCASVDEWKRAVALLKKVVPEDYASILDKIDD